MSAEAVTYTLLSGAAAVTAIFGDRVYPDHLPIEVAPPAVVYSLVSATPDGVIGDSLEATHVVRSRVQVSMIGADYAALHSARDAVVAALRNQRGTIAGTVVHAIMHDHDGPVMFDETVELWHRPIDFVIFHQQP